MTPEEKLLKAIVTPPDAVLEGDNPEEEIEVRVNDEEAYIGLSQCLAEPPDVIVMSIAQARALAKFILSRFDQ